jgi:hypothetical protein
MADYATAYAISRQRYDETVLDLNQEQLNFRLSPNSLTIGEMSLHLAGVEIWFTCQIFGREVPEEWQKVAKSATEGVVNDNPFPFSASEITPEFVKAALAEGRKHVEELLNSEDPSLREVQLKSALGPIITGDGAMARMSFHPAYHQGQAYLLRTAENFPAGNEGKPPH